MSSSKRRVHLDRSLPGQEGRTSACGMLFVDTEHDISRVSCRLCIALVVREQEQARSHTPAGGLLTGAQLRGHISRALIEARSTSDNQEPTAGPPPVLTAALWARSCKGGDYGRCRTCELCAWERLAEIWATRSVSAHNDAKRHRLQRPVGAPRWSSLTAALIALADWQRHDRAAKSASAGILARIEFGPLDGGPVREGDPLLDAAGEFVLVRRCIEEAVPAGAQGALSREQAVALLLARTPGVELAMPPYEALAARFGETVGHLRALVRVLRAHVTEELATRGLIPAPRPLARRARGIACQQSADRF
jgi:hypothetical protein